MMILSTTLQLSRVFTSPTASAIISSAAEKAVKKMSDTPNLPACLTHSHLNQSVTCGQVLLPAPPLHVRVDDEHPVLTLPDACRSLLLEQLLHLLITNEVFIPLIFLLLLVKSCDEVICVLQPPCRECKRPDVQGGQTSPCSCMLSCVEEGGGAGGGGGGGGRSCSPTALCAGSPQER